MENEYCFKHFFKQQHSNGWLKLHDTQWGPGFYATSSMIASILGIGFNAPYTVYKKAKGLELTTEEKTLPTWIMQKGLEMEEHAIWDFFYTQYAGLCFIHSPGPIVAADGFYMASLDAIVFWLTENGKLEEWGVEVKYGGTRIYTTGDIVKKGHLKYYVQCLFQMHCTGHRITWLLYYTHYKQIMFKIYFNQTLVNRILNILKPFWKACADEDTVYSPGAIQQILAPQELLDEIRDTFLLETELMFIMNK